MRQFILKTFSIFSFIIISFIISSQLLFAQSAISLKTENYTNPAGIETLKPKFSWQIKSVGKSSKQTGYQILVASSEENLKKDLGDIWNSNKQKGDQFTVIEYKGKPLESRKKYFWKAKIWNEKAKPSTYSETNFWEMGLINKSDWAAKWIGKLGTEGKPAKAIELQKEFTLSKRAIKARIYVAGMGAYFINFNGKKIGDDRMGMGWKNFQKYINYNIFEVDPELLSVGTNFISASVGNSWLANENNQFTGIKYSDGPNRLLFQMELTFYDGSIQTIGSDVTWQVRPSPVIESNLYNGEKYDASNEYNRDWQKADDLNNIENKVTTFDLEKPKFVEQTTSFLLEDTKLTAFISGLAVSPEEIKAITVTELKKGKYVFDFG